jgi:hypothetical protein
LKLQHDDTLSNIAFSINLRHYNLAALKDADEAAAAGAGEAGPPALRLIAIPLPRAGDGSQPGAVSPQYAAGALREAIEERMRTATGGGAMACHVEVVRGVEKDGARLEGAAGQIMIELSAGALAGRCRLNR